MKLPFLSNSKTTSEAIRSSSSSSSSWPWPSCTQTRTLSFRVGNDIFKTLNSTYFDPITTTTTTTQVVEPPDSSLFSTNFSDHSRPSFSTASEDSGGESIETVIKGLRSERLFFEPKAGETSSIILEEEGNYDKNNKAAAYRKLEIIPFKESVALSIDSPDPIVDFRRSMEEMVEAHGLKDWEHLEELFCWYLRVNCKSNHGYIVGAFVDLLVGLAFSTTNATNAATNCSSDIINSPSSPLSFYNSTPTTSTSSSSSSTPCASSKEESEGTTVCLSSLLEGEEDENSNDDDGASS